MKEKQINLCLPQSGLEKGLDSALRLLAARGMITLEGDLIKMTGKYAELMPYYAGSIAHFRKK